MALTTSARAPSLTLITHSSTPASCRPVRSPAMDRMQVGLALPQYDYSVAREAPLRWSTVANYATEAERLGFDSLWLADHITLSIGKYGAADVEHRGFDPITGLAALARI